jgi:hypothetical protein
MKSIVLLLILASCKHGSTPAPPSSSTTAAEEHTSFADEDPPPPYDKAALGVALIAERGAEAKAEQVVNDAEAAGDEERLQRAIADLAVRRRFIAILEVCDAQTRLCPPRLDEPSWPYLADSDEDPKLETPLRFDVDSWRKVTAELHGRACACRTLACIDGMDAMLTRLESRPMQEVQADESASSGLTGARDCLMRLRGKKALPKLARE